MATAAFAFDTSRIAFAIVLDAAAFIIWDIGTRSPARLFVDLRAGLSRAPIAAASLLRFAIGAVALILAVVVSAPVAARPLDATVIRCWALVTALVIEQLVGPDLRSRRR